MSKIGVRKLQKLIARRASGDEKAEEDMKIEDNEDESEDDFYAQVQQQRAAKLSAKAAIYKRDAAFPSLPEAVDGKRPISLPIVKNRGLTPSRNKNKKNPRENYKVRSFVPSELIRCVNVNRLSMTKLKNDGKAKSRTSRSHMVLMEVKLRVSMQESVEASDSDSEFQL